MASPGTRARWILGIVVGIGLLATGAFALSGEPTGSLVCPDEALYGVAIQCDAVGGEHVQWSDGASTAVDATHAPNAVGTVHVDLLASGGEVLDSAVIDVRPDLQVACEEGTSQPMYLVEPARSGDLPYAYIYADTSTGERITQDDERYPDWTIPISFEWIHIGDERETLRCDAVSAAAEALDGVFELVLSSDVIEPISTSRDFILGWSGQNYAGVQPAEVTATVDIDGVIARQVVPVYTLGCP